MEKTYEVRPTRLGAALLLLGFSERPRDAAINQQVDTATYFFLTASIGAVVMVFPYEKYYSCSLGLETTVIKNPDDVIKWAVKALERKGL
jgi:hypothetical protein